MSPAVSPTDTKPNRGDNVALGDKSAVLGALESPDQPVIPAHPLQSLCRFASVPDDSLVFVAPSSFVKNEMKKAKDPYFPLDGCWYYRPMLYIRSDEKQNLLLQCETEAPSWTVETAWASFFRFLLCYANEPMPKAGEKRKKSPNLAFKYS